MLLSSFIFFITIFLIILQPKNLGIGTIAMFFALVAFLFGIVNIKDVIEVWNITWDATLTFIGIIIFSLILDEIGFFEWMALKMAFYANGSGKKMFFYSLILGSIVSALFANDAAALILTPILLSKMKILKLNTKTILAFLLTGNFISDSTSLPFVFSNLTNIITANFFDIGFKEYTKNMTLPFLASVFFSSVVLYLLLKKDIPKKIDISLLKEPKKAIKNKKLFYFSWVFLAVLLSGYTIGDIFHFPICFFALGGALIFLYISYIQKVVSPIKILKQAPWQIVWFSLGLYIIVYGLKNAGLTYYLELFLQNLNNTSNTLAVLGTGFISAFLSATMNNLPSIMIMNISLENIPNDAMIYANIIGANIGPKITPFGSLATLLWLHILQKQKINITFFQYTKFGIVVTPIVLFFVLLTLIF